jgi:D-3-phosphoglycerate dehydrogenase
MEPAARRQPDQRITRSGARMTIAVIDDYQDAFRKLECYARLKQHEVVVFNDTEKDPVRLAERLKEGHWQTTVGDGLKGKTLGVYAFGKIGSVVAKVGKAFDMRVVCFGREASTARAREAGFDVAGSRDEFFSSADVLTLHLPLNAETRGIVKRVDLARMKPTALIVNTSRAPLIEEGALVEALKQGRPGRAAVDVYEDEPVLGANHPLIKMPNVVCTPHLGYVEKSTYESYYGTAVDNIVAFIAGKPVNVHNPEALKTN